MNREDAINHVRHVLRVMLAHDPHCSPSLSSEAVYADMPLMLLELLKCPTVRVNFDELTRMTAHKLSRERESE